MRTTLRWGKNRERQPIPFLRGSRLRVVRVHRLRNHAAQFHNRDGEVRTLLFRALRRRSISRRMGHGIDSAVEDSAVEVDAASRAGNLSRYRPALEPVGYPS